MAKLILILLEVFKEMFKRLGQDEAMMKLEGCWQAGAHGLVRGMWDVFADSGSNPEREKEREREREGKPSGELNLQMFLA